MALASYRSKLLESTEDLLSDLIVNQATHFGVTASAPAEGPRAGIEFTGNADKSATLGVPLYSETSVRKEKHYPKWRHVTTHKNNLRCSKCLYSSIVIDTYDDGLYHPSECYCSVISNSSINFTVDNTFHQSPIQQSDDEEILFEAFHQSNVGLELLSRLSFLKENVSTMIGSSCKITKENVYHILNCLFDIYAFSSVGIFFVIKRIYNLIITLTGDYLFTNLEHFVSEFLSHFPSINLSFEKPKQQSLELLKNIQNLRRGASFESLLDYEFVNKTFSMFKYCLCMILGKGRILDLKNQTGLSNDLLSHLLNKGPKIDYRNLNYFSLFESSLDYTLWVMEECLLVYHKFKPSLFTRRFTFNTCCIDFDRLMQTSIKDVNTCVESSIIPGVIYQTSEDFIIDCDMFIDQSEALRLYMYDVDKSFISMINHKISEVHRRRTTEYMKIGSTYRDQPFAIMVEGPPSIGKTAVSNDLYKLYSTFIGKSDNSLSKFHTRTEDSEYWDGAPEDMNGVLLDDFGQWASHLNELTGYKEVLRMINGQPFPLNMAAVELKGKRYFNAHIIIGTTNVGTRLASTDLCAHAFYNDVRAMLRRFRYRVTLRLKKEARRKPDGTYTHDTLVNPIFNEKTRLSDNHDYKITEVYMEEQNPGSPSIIAYKDLTDHWMNQEEYVLKLRDLFTEHKERNEKFKQIISEQSKVSLEFCPNGNCKTGLKNTCNCRQTENLNLNNIMATINEHVLKDGAGSNEDGNPACIISQSDTSPRLSKLEESRLRAEARMKIAAKERAEIDEMMLKYENRNFADEELNDWISHVQRAHIYMEKLLMVIVPINMFFHTFGPMFDFPEIISQQIGVWCCFVQAHFIAHFMLCKLKNMKYLDSNALFFFVFQLACNISSKNVATMFILYLCCILYSTFSIPFTICYGYVLYFMYRLICIYQYRRIELQEFIKLREHKPKMQSDETKLVGAVYEYFVSKQVDLCYWIYSNKTKIENYLLILCIILCVFGHLFLFSLSLLIVILSKIKSYVDKKILPFEVAAEKHIAVLAKFDNFTRNHENVMQRMIKDAGISIAKHYTNMAKKKLLKTLPKVAIALSTGLILISIIKMYKRKFKKKNEPQVQGATHSVEKPIYEKDDPEVRGKKSNMWQSNDDHIFERAQILSKFPIFESDEAFCSSIKNQLVRIEYEYNDGSSDLITRASGIIYSGHIVITAAHSLGDFRGKVRVTVKNNNPSTKVSVIATYDAKSFYWNEKKDVLAFALQGIPAFKSIDRYIGEIPISSLNGQFLHTCLTKEFLFQSSKGSGRYMDVESYDYCNLGKSLYINYADGNLLKSGSSGSPVFHIWNGRYIFVGIHVAMQYNTKSIVSIITPDVFKEIKDKFEFLSIGFSSKRIKPIQQCFNEDCVDPLCHQSSLRKANGHFIPMFTINKYHRHPRKSNCIKSIYYEEPNDDFKKYKPHMKKGWAHDLEGNTVYIDPYDVSLQQEMNAVTGVDIPLFEFCIDEYFNGALNMVPLEDFVLPREWNTYEVLNGKDGVAFIDKIKRNTSSGFPEYKVKRDLFTLDDQGKVIGIPQELQDNIERYVLNYKSGEPNHPVFTCTLKDEFVSAKKRNSGATRVFYASPLEFLMIQKQFLGWILPFTQRNPFAFECAIGTNACSDEWSHFYDYLTEHGKNRIVAGDFAAFDKMGDNYLRYIIYLRFFSTMRKYLNYHISDCQNFALGRKLETALIFLEQSEQILQGVAYDDSYPVKKIYGDFYRGGSGFPSGSLFTATMNSFYNAILMRYCFYMNLRLSGTSISRIRFKDHVNLLTYGDDNIMGVKNSNLHDFSHTVITNLLECVNITYTMADKTTESVPFITIGEASFLKRSFLPSNYGILAPLDIKSIYKMVNYIVKSKFLSPEEQSIEAARTACFEAYFHGETFFNNFISEMEMRMEKTDLKFPLPTKDMINSIIEQHYVKLQSSSISMKPKAQSSTRFRSDWALHRSYTLNDRLRIAIIKEGRVRRRLGTKVTLESFCGDDPNIQMKFVAGSFLVYKATWRKLKRTPNTNNNTIKFGSQETKQNVTFDDNSGGVALSARNVDMSKIAPGSANVSLEDFLKRPVALGVIDFSTTFTMPTDAVNPWKGFLLNAGISEKLSNFKLIRGTLVVRFVPNGSPYHWGSALVTYAPLQGLYHSTQTGIADNFLTHHSQYPHLWIDPANSVPIELELPFALPVDWLDLTGSVSQFEDMGLLRGFSVVDLQNSDGLPTSIDVTVYAYMKDVEIAFATGAPIAQSDTEYKDEGAISAPATVVAKTAALMSDLPYIGPFALATEIAASGVASIAKIFGYSRVPNIEDQSMMRPMMFSNSAQVTGKFSNGKLSLDPKQELTVGDGGYGVISDTSDYTISGIAEKECWIGNCLWPIGGAVNDVLTAFPVAVGYVQSEAGISGYSPAAFATNPFQYWRGTSRFHIKVIANKFARGRLAICYEPTNDSGILFDTVPNVNDGLYKPYVHVIDISDTHDITIDIPWTQARNFQTATPAVIGTTNYKTAMDYFMFNNTNNDTCNGYITIKILNAIAGIAPANAGITLQVSHCLCDLEVYKPVRPIQQLQLSENSDFNFWTGVTAQAETLALVPIAQSETFSADANRAEADADTSQIACESTSSSLGQGISVYGGERINSVIALTKRFAPYFTYKADYDDVNVDKIVSVEFGLPGMIMTKPNSTAASYLTYAGYFGPAYLGSRGGVRYQYNIYNNGKQVETIAMRGPAVNQPTPNGTHIHSGLSWQTSNQFGDGFNGLLRQTVNTMGGVEVESPFYYNKKFLVAKGENFVESGDLGGIFIKSYCADSTQVGTFVTTVTQAAADDFSFGWFLATPIFYD